RTRRRPPSPTLFPYTTLFRSDRDRRGRKDGGRVPELRPDGQGRARRGQATPPHVAQKVPQSAAPGHPATGRCPDPRGHPSEPERSEEHTSELQSLAYLVCRLL